MQNTARTSWTHPLQVDALECKSGVLGMTFCPGKKDTSSQGVVWDRDLTVDLDAIESWHADIVITLLEAKEFTLLEVPNFTAEMTTRSFRWIHMPIRDMSVPATPFVQRWHRVLPLLLDSLENKGKVLIHCRGGLGRTGLVAASLLVGCGLSPQDAIQSVRCARPGTIETPEQEDYVRRSRLNTPETTAV